MSLLSSRYLNRPASSDDLSIFKCVICHKILRRPKQAVCGCRFCSNCLDSYLNDSEKSCPVCQNSFKISKENVIVDKAIERDISNFLTKCRHKNCKTYVKFKYLIGHMKSCAYKENHSIGCQENKEKPTSHVPIIFSTNSNPATDICQEENYYHILPQHTISNNLSRQGHDETVKSLVQESTPKDQGHLLTQIDDKEFRWTIADIRDKIKFARQHNSKPIISEPFYLFHEGYKMQLKVYPNGHGKSTNRSLSTYCVLIEGEYDDYLEWPFKMKVLITTSCNYENDMSVIISPNDNQMCYGRPRNDANVGFGEPDLISTSSILNNGQFILDGKLQIGFVFKH